MTSWQRDNSSHTSLQSVLPSLPHINATRTNRVNAEHCLQAELALCNLVVATMGFGCDAQASLPCVCAVLCVAKFNPMFSL